MLQLVHFLQKNRNDFDDTSQVNKGDFLLFVDERHLGIFCSLL